MTTPRLAAPFAVSKRGPTIVVSPPQTLCRWRADCQLTADNVDVSRALPTLRR